MTGAEFWVMRVVLHYKRERTMAAQIAVMALVDAGTFALLPCSSIAEPVEVFATEAEAQEHRRKLLRDNPSEDYRVILNADVIRD